MTDQQQPQGQPQGQPTQAPTQEGVFTQGVPTYQAPTQHYQVPNQPQYQPTPVAQPTVPTQAPSATPSYSDDPLSVSVQVFSQGAGIAEDAIYSALSAALQYNDPNLINLDQVTASLKPEQKEQAKALAKALYTQAQDSKTRTLNSAYSKAGGEANWKQAVEAFKANAPDYLKQAAAALETSNAEGAIDLVLQTVQSLGFVNTQQGTPLLGSSVGSTVKGISQAEYRSQLDAIIKETGSVYNLQSHPKFAQLTESRNLGVQQGI